MNLMRSLRICRWREYYKQEDCLISGFRREGGDNCSLLGYYAASSGNFLATFRENLSVPSPRVKKPKMKAVKPSTRFIYIYIYYNNNNIYLTAIGLSPGGSGFKHIYKYLTLCY